MKRLAMLVAVGGLFVLSSGRAEAGLFDWLCCHHQEECCYETCCPTDCCAPSCCAPAPSCCAPAGKVHDAPKPEPAPEPPAEDAPAPEPKPEAAA
ncbi:MAG: hypothetical protein KY476_14035 [Planctomycetes bacterium]|nr:hypothetical protein [Planctomycetota bacterium]